MSLNVRAFRRCLALFFISYWSRFIFDIDLYYFQYLPKTGIFSFEPFFGLRHVVYSLLFLFCFLLLFGYLRRWQLVFFILLSLNFFWQNPYLMHEAQPMAFLMLLSFFYLPLNDRDEPNLAYPKLLILFLGIYYFLAAVKKLPDVNWREGKAIWYLMQWDVIAMSTTVNHWVINNCPIWIFQVLSWFVLGFEFSFIFFVFTRFRKYLVPAGLVMHLLISSFLDIGSLGQLMLVWYALL